MFRTQELVWVMWASEHSRTVHLWLSLIKKKLLHGRLTNKFMDWVNLFDLNKVGGN